MDRRYSQARFYDGTRASSGSAERSEVLVRQSLEKARRLNSAAQSYGGSTGGLSSAGGVSVSALRGTELSDARQIYKTYGSGALGGSELGGRSNLAELKGYRNARQEQGL